jgi:hypothetical protein
MTVGADNNQQNAAAGAAKTADVAAVGAEVALAATAVAAAGGEALLSVAEGCSDDGGGVWGRAWYSTCTKK